MNNFFDLNNKLAIVTGSSRGIGKSLSIALTNSDWNIIFAPRSMDNLTIIKSQIEDIGK